MGAVATAQVVEEPAWMPALRAAQAAGNDVVVLGGAIIAFGGREPDWDNLPN